MLENGSDTSLPASDDGRIPDNGLTIEGPPFGLEKIYDYEPGGHHPVHLGDMLHQRYKVIHKLGSGGYANVWLCRDMSSAHELLYTAVKIITAEGSTKECPELRVTKLLQLGLDQTASASQFCLPLDQFEIDGPNGVHFAFVYPVLGPRTSRMLNIATSKDPGGLLRKICVQVTQAIATLHEHGICHGDVRPANILAHISGLNGLAEEEVIEILGKPQTTKVITADGSDHHMLIAPQYLVFPIDWDYVALTRPSLIEGNACLIDFGEAYEMSTPTPDLGIPQIYCPPEYSIEGEVGVGCDIWALGCTLYEIRTGRKLFDTFDDDTDEILCKVAMMLGKYPEPWWSKTWESRKEFFEDEPDTDGRVVEVHRTAAGAAQHGEDEPRAIVSQREEPRSLQDAIALGLFYEHRHGPGGIQSSISQEEAGLFADLLAKLLRYSPQERLSARGALEHGWFSC